MPQQLELTAGQAFADDIAIADGRVTVRNEAALASEKMDRLVREAVFGDAETREQARWLIWELGQEVGVRPLPRFGCHDSMYRFWESVNGRPRISTALTSVNTVVFMPMPSPIARTTTSVKPGSATSLRTA